MDTLEDPRYAELLSAVANLHDGAIDPLGRPRAEHFERVVQRLLARHNQATRVQIEAALLHDVLIHPKGGRACLDRLGVGGDTLDILERLVPPPNANYFQDLDKFTDADNADYLIYIKNLIASGHQGAIAVKLADVEDTVAVLQAIGGGAALKQLARQYEPSRQLLSAADQ